jgi:hypothetical protein
MSESKVESQYFPELLFCLCAASGTDTRAVTDALSDELMIVGYEPIPIRLSALMSDLPGFQYLRDIAEEDVRIQKSMAVGNQIRRVIGAADAVARLALIDNPLRKGT